MLASVCSGVRSPGGALAQLCCAHQWGAGGPLDGSPPGLHQAWQCLMVLSRSQPLTRRVFTDPPVQEAEPLSPPVNRPGDRSAEGVESTHGHRVSKRQDQGADPRPRPSRPRPPPGLSVGGLRGRRSVRTRVALTPPPTATGTHTHTARRRAGPFPSPPRLFLFARLMLVVAGGHIMDHPNWDTSASGRRAR